MRKPKKIDYYDFSDRVSVAEGYEITQVPDLTRDNFQYLVDEYNNLVECFNEMSHLVRINFDDEG